MKKLLLLLAFPILGVSSQIEGTWKLAGQAGALAVGSDLTNLTWFSSSAGDVTTRACLFDDSIKFAPGGIMTHYMDGSTWLENWQGAPEGCGTPVAPHTGGAATYTFDAALGTLTVNGLGAHIGLAKVSNAGELTSPAGAVSSITYNVIFSNGGNTMTVQINFGPGWWQFVYQKTAVINPPTPNVTFKVDMSQYSGPAYTGVFINGTFNGWNGTSNPMADANMDGVWEVTVPIGAGTIEYKFTLDGWNGQESLIPGSSCTITTGANTNRVYTVSGDAVLGIVCYNSCTACASNQIEGTWKLAGQAGALSVGPALNNLIWFSSNLGDVTTRACLFDDSIKFAPGGIMTHYMDGSTWLEGWQGAPAEGCGTPVAPHTGGTATYTFDAALGTLTVNGLGAHIGLAKVHNAGELTSPAGAVSSITYNVIFSNGGNTMTVQINFGPGWWQFVYQKTAVNNPPPAPPLQPAGLVANSPTTSSIFVACGPNQVGGNNILYRLFYSPTASAPMNPQTASEYAFGTTAGDGNGVGPFGFNVTGLQAATNYTFWLYQYNTVDQLFSTPSSVSETTLGGGTAVPITFTVDMNQSSMPAGSIPEVNGTFNNWCGSCASMTDANADGVWEKTISLAAGMYEYKFSYSNWTGQESLLPGSSCTITTGANTNRALTVGSAAMVLPSVCWNSCSACLTGPTSSILSGSSAICAGDSTNLSVQIVGGTSPFTVVITDGTNNYSSSGTSPVLFTVSPTLTTTTYSIVSVSGGGVGTGNSGTASVSVTPNSINSLTISADNSYTWSNTGQTYTTSGTYTGTTANCVTEQLILTITGAGLEDLSDMGIFVQPNPSNGLFSIMNSEQVNLTGSITDGSGREIYSADLNALENTIDISVVARGIYYLKLSSLNYSKVVQIFKN